MPGKVSLSRAKFQGICPQNMALNVQYHLICEIPIDDCCSQVPADYSPTTAYATYAEAYGTSNETGACTNKWPTGFWLAVEFQVLSFAYVSLMW